LPPDAETARAARIDAFLAEAGLGDAAREPLPGDASTRRYVRLIRDGRAPLMLMDAPPSAESAPCGPDATAEERRAAGYNALARLSACRVDAFVATADWLRAQGLSAPEVAAFDSDDGFAVLEDLGEDLYARLIERGASSPPLYAAAVDVLVRLHETTPPAVLPLEGAAGWPLLTYDALALKTGCDLFLEWWPRYAGLPPFTPEAQADWAALWAQVQARGEAGASVFAHRDYHAENLLWLPGREGVGRVGLLDFQDAVRAHPAWDLLSLLQDARRDVEPELEAAMLDRYLTARPAMARDAFLSDYAGLAALNNARIAGLFARLVVRDGKPRYRGFLDRMGRLLARNLEHPDMAGLKAWFARHAPQGVRA
jgi:aminoglycoside/choline kinase family phosphotransferase